ncbi:carbohydrate deacetylase isoform X1 [Nomascus leucogenys]|uniref:carbohydrate deacetylase isoform X1 n=1 Tax=Nomascus leucogenys TaxID=61853 RepID=UPI00122D69BF|nr:carbohydrate deacetylase isoform X1 [Nomascus leucogenys]
MSRPRMRLVVTADDFGYCPRRDEGIVEAFLAGAVTSVSLLVNGAATESAAELARRHSIPTGLHANLSEGRPVGPARRGASSLLGPEGFFLGKMGFREAVAAGDVDLPQVRSRSYRRMLVRTPRAPPGGYCEAVRSWRWMASSFKNTGAVTRKHEEGILGSYSRSLKVSLARPLGAGGARGPTKLLSGAAGQGPHARGRAPARARAPRWTDAFVGLSTCGRHMSAHRVSGALARVLEGTLAGHTLTAELMAHPGYPSVPPTGGCGEGPDAFSCSWERLHELRVLTAPTLRAQLTQDGVQLCALDDLDFKRPGEEVPCEATLEPFLEPSLL